MSFASCRPAFFFPSSFVFMLISIFFVPSADGAALLPSGNDHLGESVDFWLSTELVSADFRKGCLSTALCHQPAFKLVHTMTLNGQRALISWPLDGGGGSGGGATTAQLLREQPRQFVSHWDIGDPEDVSIGCQIAGTDPSFGFARVCDETPSRRVFQEALVRRPVMQNNIHRVRREKGTDGTDTFSAAAGDKMVVEMRGRCFNVTLLVRKHTQRCPWCPDPNVHIHVAGGGPAGTSGGQLQGADSGESQQQLKGTDSLLLLHNIVILALSGAVVFAFTGLCAVVFAQRRHRKRHPLKGGGRVKLNVGGGVAGGGTMGSAESKRRKRTLKLVSPPRTLRSLPVSPQATTAREHSEEQLKMVFGGGSRTVGTLRGNSSTTTNGGDEAEEERYDIPWDNKYCLVPRQWLLSNGTAGGPLPPPLDSAALRPPSQLHHYPPAATPFGPPALASFRDNNNKYAICSDFCSHPRSPPTMGTMSARIPPPDQPPPPHPPPPPPQPMVPNSARHSQLKALPQCHQNCQQQIQSFTSPNTSSGAGSRHDDSGLDSV